jgi:hypothetical protein
LGLNFFKLYKKPIDTSGNAAIVSGDKAVYSNIEAFISLPHAADG